MKKGYYSLANSASGDADPDEIEVFDVEGDSECAVRGCIRSDEHEHTYISWHGNGYQRQNSWLASDADDVESLEEMR